MSQRLLHRLTRHAKRTPHAPAVRRADGAERTVVTYRELAVAVSITAAQVARFVAPGDVVLLVCPNDARFHTAFLAILAAGGRAFPVSPDSTAAELAAAAERSGAALVIGTDAALAAVNVPAKLPLPAPVADPEARGLLRLLARDTRAGGLLLQSSGTTGLPKIVLRGAASLDAVADQMVEAIGFRPGDRVLMCLPLCHSYGLEHGLLAPVLAGACVHLLSGFDLHAVGAQLADTGIDVFPGVPFMFEALARQGGGRMLPSLRRAYSAGGPLPGQVGEAFRARYGVRVSQLYGATEIGSVTYGDPQSEAFDPAGVGRPMRGVAVRILDTADPRPGRPLPPGAEGQVAVRAESMLSGYVPDETPPTLDGFFLTGDLGTFDSHGTLTITGRTKLLIEVGGLKVNPLEVEAVLMQHPGVERCVVIPVRVSETVCRLKAVVTPRPGAEAPPTPESLRKFARERLVPYKVPRVFEVRDALPLSPTGKVLRHLVAA
jgi:acyl-CoA synthetase (AMP-forming)/AMP-acid ligase II